MKRQKLHGPCPSIVVISYRHIPRHPPDITNHKMLHYQPFSYESHPKPVDVAGKDYSILKRNPNSFKLKPLPSAPSQPRQYSAPPKPVEPHHRAKIFRFSSLKLSTTEEKSNFDNICVAAIATLARLAINQAIAEIIEEENYSILLPSPTSTD